MGGRRALALHLRVSSDGCMEIEWDEVRVKIGPEGKGQCGEQGRERRLETVPEVPPNRGDWLQGGKEAETTPSLRVPACHLERPREPSETCHPLLSPPGGGNGVLPHQGEVSRLSCFSRVERSFP